MSCSATTPNCNCKKTPCGCENAISVAPPCSVGTNACPNPEPCAETWSDCCVVHNGDTFTYISADQTVPADANAEGPIPVPVRTGFTTFQGERWCDTWQRFIVYYECRGDSLTPYGLKSNTITTTTINISWYAVTNATDYEIWVAPVSTSVFSLAGSIVANTTPNYTITGLSPNTSYYVYVRTYDANGDIYSCASVSLILTTKIS